MEIPAHEHPTQRQPFPWNQRKRHTVISSLLCSCLCLGLASGVNADTCIPATADGAGLQACLISTAPGDTILLDPGTYVPTTPVVFPSPGGETFFISKALTIRGAGPGVVLSGDLGAGARAFNVVIINADAAPGPVTLENLTIQDGDSSTGGFFAGGGIIDAPNQTVTLDQVTVQHNTAFSGGGVWVSEGSTWTIVDSDFLHNTALNDGDAPFPDGGAIAAAGALALVIDGGLFDGNSAPNGFGGAIDSSSQVLQISHATFSNNTADESGGALTIHGVLDSYLIDNCTFANNVTTDIDEGGGFGGAIDIFDIVGEGAIIGSTFHRNTSSFLGGAVYITHGHAILEGNDFRENHADSSIGSGGAIGIQGDETMARSTNVTLDRNRFRGNTAFVAGAVFAYNISSIGSSRPSGLSFSKNRYTGNSATFGGAVGIGLTEPGLNNLNENVSLTKEHYKRNTATGAIGALSLINTAGTASKLRFKQNDAGGVIDSLNVENSPGLSFAMIKIVGEDANDCLVDGVPTCP